MVDSQSIVNELLLLAILVDKGKSYGYQIRQDLTNQGVILSESSIYVCLRRMAEKGLVSMQKIEINDRVRKYYDITDLGKQQFRGYVDHLVLIDRIIWGVVGNDKERIS